MPFSDQRWLLFEETYAIHKWYNLTVTNAGYENQGKVNKNNKVMKVLRKVL